MATQSEHRPNFIHTAGGQTILLIAALVVIMAVAWIYIW